jgi:hypothetical protein
LSIDASNFTQQNALPSFDPFDLFAPFPYATRPLLFGPSSDSNVTELHSELAALREENQTLKTNLIDVTKEVADVRSALYTEMARNAHLKRQAMADTGRLQTFTVAFSRYKAIDGLLARVGLHKVVLEEALAALESGGDPGEVVIDAVKEKAVCTLSETTIIGPRTPEHYAAALNMTLRTRKELKGHKKIIKFWKRVAQQDGKHKDIITPSSSKISSIYETLGPERQKAVNELAARRREILACKTAPVPEEPTNLVQYSCSPAFMPAAEDTGSSIYADAFATLPPLASESIKRELAQHSASKRFSGSRPFKGGSVLRQVDLNVPQASMIPDLNFRTQIRERRQTVPVCLPLTYLSTVVVALILMKRTRHLPCQVGTIRPLLLRTTQEQRVRGDTNRMPHPLDRSAPYCQLRYENRTLALRELSKPAFQLVAKDRGKTTTTMNTVHSQAISILRTSLRVTVSFQTGWSPILALVFSNTSRHNRLTWSLFIMARP